MRERKPGPGLTSRIVVVMVGLILIAHSAAAADRDEFELRTLETTRTAMAILTGWSAVNLVTGTTFGLLAEDPVQAAFWQMNAGWNVVNAALGLPALIRSNRDLNNLPSDRSVEEIVAEKNRMEDILLFNAGIDVAYMMTGVYLLERARRGGSDAAMLEGFGVSLLVQGGFLFVFDLGAYLFLRRVAPVS